MGSSLSSLPEIETSKRDVKTKKPLLPAIHDGCKIAKPYQKGQKKKVSFQTPSVKPQEQLNPAVFLQKPNQIRLVSRQTIDLLTALEISLICLVCLLLYLLGKGLIDRNQFGTGVKTLLIVVFIIYNGYVYLFIPRKTYLILWISLGIAVVYSFVREKRQLKRQLSEPTDTLTDPKVG